MDWLLINCLIFLIMYHCHYILAAPVTNDEYDPQLVKDIHNNIPMSGKPRAAGSIFSSTNMHVEGIEPQDWNRIADNELDRALRLKKIVAKAKNIILFIGDGMGISTLTTATWRQAQQERKHISKSKLSFYDLPHIGLARTYTADRMTPDSAATATAIVTGEKIGFLRLGIRLGDKLRGCQDITEDAKLDTIMMHAHKEGKWTGFVTTTTVTHATPASNYAKTPSRFWEGNVEESIFPENKVNCKDIARQFVEDHGYIRVAMGGGRIHFINNTESDPEVDQRGGEKHKGTRIDGKNLMKEWLDKKKTAGLDDSTYKLVQNLSQFDAIDTKKVDYLLGLFNPELMHPESYRQRIDGWKEPSLSQMTRKAIEILKRGPNGFYLMVEGGNIDSYHHVNRATLAISETLELSKAVKVALEETSEEDTLIIVTSDHSHHLTLGGYASINEDVLGLTSFQNASDDKPFLILNYGQGPGYYEHKRDLSTGRMFLDQETVLKGGNSYVFDSGLPMTVDLGGGTHSGEDVAIFARGPYAHLFHSVHEQHYIAHVMMYASCLGPRRTHCSQSNSAQQIHQKLMFWPLILCALLTNFAK